MKIDIQEINRRHLLLSDVMYRINYGLYSRLMKYQNGIIYLEIMFTDRWKKGYNNTCRELAYCWRDANRELANAIGCKVHIVDARKYPHKKDLYLKSNVAKYDIRRGILFYDEILN